MQYLKHYIKSDVHLIHCKNVKHAEYASYNLGTFTNDNTRSGN